MEGDYLFNYELSNKQLRIYFIEVSFLQKQYNKLIYLGS